MTDKQIIIDGVDVSGCGFYDDRCGYCDACKDDIDGNSYTKCMYEDDCYYKQLKRKEQECDELKKIIDEAKNSKLDLKSFLVGEAVQNEYEQQLDQLKAENEAYKKMLEDEDVQLALTEVRTGERHLWFNKAEKYKQVLTDIKNIVDTCNSGIICSECPYSEECRTDTEAEALGVCKLIQQKFEGLDEI